MKNSILSKSTTKCHNDLCEILNKSIKLLEDKPEYEDYSVHLKNRLHKMDSAALFVVVGEVKAGKSSFINALMGEEICEVDAAPCTARVEELTYGSERYITQLGPKCVRKTLNKETLKEITIVDTPGTNSIIEDHEAITKKYIPESDVAIFVLPAKNPHTESAWKLLSFVNEDWLCKCVFILQQKDLTSDSELDTNMRKVAEYARNRGIQDPLIFPLSAKMEKENYSNSGFSEFRDHLKNQIEGGEVRKIKVQSTKNIITEALKKVRSQEEMRYMTAKSEVQFLSGLLSKVSRREERAKKTSDMYIDKVKATYSELTKVLESDFKKLLGASNVFTSVLPGKTSLKEALEELQSTFAEKAKESLQVNLKEVMVELDEEVSAINDELDESLKERIQNKPASRSRAERLRDHLAQIQSKKIEDTGAESMPSISLGLTACTGFGAALLLWAQGSVLDITGGIISAIGLSSLGMVFLVKKKKIIKEFSASLESSKAGVEENINIHVNTFLNKFFSDIRSHLEGEQAPLESEMVHHEELIINCCRLIEETRSLVPSNADEELSGAAV